MRRSFPTALALAALATVGVCEMASAAMNNLNPSTPVLTTTIKTKPKLPAGPTTSTSSPMEKTNATATSTSAVSPSNAMATAPAAQSTAPNSSVAPTNSKPGNQAGLPPAVQLRQDITKQEVDIKKSENYIATLQEMKLHPPLPWPGRPGFGPTPLNPIVHFQLPGGPAVDIAVRFDRYGQFASGEVDRILNIVRATIDKTIHAETQRIAADKKRVAADYVALGSQD